jgi:hypothetical protein
MYAEILRKQKTVVDKEGNILGIDQRNVPSLSPATTASTINQTGSTPTTTATKPSLTVTQTPQSKKAAEAEVKAQQVAQLDFKTDLENINKALERTSEWSTGWGSYLKVIPNTDAMALDDVVQSVKSGQLLNNLKALKDSSPTGASGFGSLTEKEGQQLMAKVRTLNPASKTFVEDLNFIKEKLVKLNNIKTGTPTQEPPTGSETGGWSIRRK